MLFDLILKERNVVDMSFEVFMVFHSSSNGLGDGNDIKLFPVGFFFFFFVNRPIFSYL